MFVIFKERLNPVKLCCLQKDKCKQIVVDKLNIYIYYVNTSACRQDKFMEAYLPASILTKLSSTIKLKKVHNNTVL